MTLSVGLIMPGHAVHRITEWRNGCRQLAKVFYHITVTVIWVRNSTLICYISFQTVTKLTHFDLSHRLRI